MYYIYLYTRISDGMQYVGQVLKRREKQREWEHRTCQGKTYFDNEYSNHTEDFIYAIIDEAKNLREANEKEIYWIAELKTKFPDGYNLTDGGGGRQGSKHTEESKQKMSINHPDVSNEKNPFYGKHHTEESKQKNRDAHIGKNKGKEHPRAKPILCVELNIAFETLTQATEWLQNNGYKSASRSNLRSGIKNNKMRYGYHWRDYTEEV